MALNEFKRKKSMVLKPFGSTNFKMLKQKIRTRHLCKNVLLWLRHTLKIDFKGDIHNALYIMWITLCHKQCSYCESFISFTAVTASLFCDTFSFKGNNFANHSVPELDLRKKKRFKGIFSESNSYKDSEMVQGVS